MERLVIERFGYQPLQGVADDVLLVEWDIAVDREGLARFAARARAEPDRVLVAPYRLYYPSLPEPVWAHRHWDGLPADANTPGSASFVAAGDPFCALFGLGMVYLPREVIAAFFADRPSNHVGDVELSMWHYRNVAERVPIAWDVLPVHLNYEIEGVVS